MKILFVGDSWLGSNARSLKEALGRSPGVQVDEINVDLFIPNFSKRPLRAVNRLIRAVEISEMKRGVLNACEDFQPDLIVIYKGQFLDADFIRLLQTRYAPVTNVFPDLSPHVHGSTLRSTMDTYDLVISTKAFHPGLWKEVYGYSNRCVHVSHGYDPSLHLRDAPSDYHTHDVVMIASGRTEYEALVRDLLRLHQNLRIAVGGGRWERRGLESIPGVTLIGEKFGWSYVGWLRRAKIVIAPVQTVVHADGKQQPGDEVSARTFECAAAYAFFMHRRTAEARQLYDETTEVPMYDTPAELGEKIAFYLSAPAARESMAAAAHARAVPAYSMDSRATEIIQLLKNLV